MSPLSALELAEHVVADGFDAQKDALTVLYREALERSVSGVLVEVAGDDAEPRPVRERALGKLVVEFSRAA
ncbi:MAG: hypothetical protein AB8G14_11130 [Ilumatobacter sp.]